MSFPNWKKKCLKCKKISLVVRRNLRDVLFWGCSRFPRCKNSESFSRIEYSWLGIELDWYPNFKDESGAFKVLEKCQSKPEIAYIFGTFYFLQEAKNDLEIEVRTISYKQMEISGLYLQDAWTVWNNSGLRGPGCILLVPQFPFGEKLHHDFVLLYQWDHSPKNDSWEIKCAVEVDFHPAHNFTTFDAYRDSLVNYPVFRFSKKIDPREWVKRLLAYESSLQSKMRT